MKVLFVPFFIGGHTNAVLGLAEELLGRGHEVAFLLEPTKAKQLKTKGFIVELLDLSGCPLTEESIVNFIKSPSWIDYCRSLLQSPKNPFSMLDINSQIEVIIKRVKPDVIIVDSFCS